MTQKTISIPEDLYEKLKSKKQKNETFPDLINRLLEEQEKKEEQHTIMDLAGALDDDSDEWEEITKILYEDRLRPNKRKQFSLQG